MDDLDFTISASGRFGNFMWEYPDDIKEIFQKLQEIAGKDTVLGIMESQKQAILGFLHIQLGITNSGRLAPILAKNVNKHLREMIEESLKILRP
ncbi:MAG: hypothetical protein Q7K16_03370 [Candidatus Azambacteria bacterium]|nr:hypothetical protein [Candidatus Azambacteria bacterium]